MSQNRVLMSYETTERELEKMQERDLEVEGSDIDKCLFNHNLNSLVKTANPIMP